jgi:hypothetical protein
MPRITAQFNMINNILIFLYLFKLTYICTRNECVEDHINLLKNKSAFLYFR